MQAALEPLIGEWMNSLTRQSSQYSPVDEELCLITLCCHPELSVDARLALTLKAVCGFTVEEIARALLATPPTIAQRIVRAKTLIKERRLEFVQPTLSALSERMPSVLKTIYLMFNEGYSASGGDTLIREELCLEALRLAELVAGDARTSHPEAHALASLLLFQHARHRARVEPNGEPRMLDQQDRTLWDKNMIARGFLHLSLAKNGELLTTYHLEAGIASVHAAAASWGDTDWKQLVSYYDTLHEIAPSPVVRVNQAVAVSMLDGTDRGVGILRSVASDKAMANYAPFHMALGELEMRSGNRRQARDAFQRALELAMSTPERNLVRKKLNQVLDA
jgi:RNA polymerase sigma-70 factor (ECF subfamily)